MVKIFTPFFLPSVYPPPHSRYQKLLIISTHHIFFSRDRISHWQSGQICLDSFYHPRYLHKNFKYRIMNTTPFNLNSTRSRLARCIFYLLLLAIFPSCTKHIYIPVESHSVDSVANHSLHVDTIIFRDSIKISMRGDSVSKEVWRDRIKIRHSRDTIFRSRTDTVRIPVEIPMLQPPTSPRISRIEQIINAIKAIKNLFIVLAILAVLVFTATFILKKAKI